MPSTGQSITLLITLLLALAHGSVHATTFTARVDLGADGQIDQTAEVQRVGLDELDKIALADPGTAYRVTFEGAVQVDADGLYRVQASGTHTWRVWVNGVLVLDYSHATSYEKAIAEAEHWQRLSEAVVPMKAGVVYPVRLEYMRAGGMPSVAGDVALSIGAVGQPLTPAVSVAGGAAEPAPHPARRASDFHASNGLVVNQLQRFSDADYQKLKARLGELGITTIRGAFYPWVAEAKNLDGRYRDLYESLGIELCGVIRESFVIDDPDSMMADMAVWVERSSDYLKIVEGPNEPYGKTENFNYRGHGRQHRTGKPLGDGWTRGVSLFMQDLHQAVSQLPADDDIPVLAAASTVFGPWRPDNPLAEFVRAEGLVLGESFAFNNMHKYHMAWPNARFYEHQRKVREQSPDAPWIITEMGWNSGDVDHDQVSPRRKTTYTLRNHLLAFNAGSQANYTFALYHHQPVKGRGVKAFGLLHADFTPRPAFHALRRLMQLTRDVQGDALPVVAGELAYRLDTDGPEPMRTLLTTSGGDFLLVLWLETGQSTDRTRAILRLPNAMQIAVHQPTERDQPVRTLTAERLGLVITGDPVVIRLTPVVSGAESTP
ncbi:MAG: PA14 domain-containing protein [Planctomycetota bacterium]